MSTNQIAQFAARELNVSLAELKVDKTPWALIGISDVDGIVRSYELSKGNSAPCVKIHLSLSRSFVVEKIFYSKSIDRIINGEIVLNDNGNPEKIKVMAERNESKNPRLLIKVLRLIFTTQWALLAAKHGEVTPHFLACSCITEQLGLEMFSDRQMLQGFSDATENQLIRAEQRYLELEPQLTLMQSDAITVTVKALEASDEKPSDAVLRQKEVDLMVERMEEQDKKTVGKKSTKKPKMIQGETIIYTAQDGHDLINQSETLATV